MFKPPSPVTMAAKSSASVFTGRAEVNRLVQVQGYRFFAIDLPKMDAEIRRLLQRIELLEKTLQ